MWQRSSDFVPVRPYRIYVNVRTVTRVPRGRKRRARGPGARRDRVSRARGPTIPCIYQYRMHVVVRYRKKRQPVCKGLDCKTGNAAAVRTGGLVMALWSIEHILETGTNSGSQASGSRTLPVVERRRGPRTQVGFSPTTFLFAPVAWFFNRHHLCTL